MKSLWTAAAVCVGVMVLSGVPDSCGDETNAAIEALRAKADLTFDDEGRVTAVDFNQRITVDDDVRYLRFLPNVREVNLAYCFLISDEAARYVADAPSVQRVMLYRNNPSPPGNNFTGNYDLSKQPVITDESLRHLAKLPHLEELGLWDNDFTDRGVEFLKQATTLREIGLRSSRVSCAKLEELSRSLPKCTIDAELALRDASGEFLRDDSGHIRVDNVFLGPERRLPFQREQLMGKPAVVTGTLLGGKPFDWNKYQGKPVLLLYWTARHDRVDNFKVDHVLEHYRVYHDKGLEVVGVNTDYVEYHYLVKKWLHDKQIPWPNLVRGEESPLLNGLELGEHLSVLIDRTGRIVYMMPSTLDDLWGRVEQMCD